MKFWWKLSIQNKIQIFFGLVLVVYVIGIIITYSQLREINAIARELPGKADQMLLLQESAVIIAGIDSRVDKFFVAGYSEHRDKTLELLTELKSTYVKISDLETAPASMAQRTSATTPAIKKELEEIQTAVARLENNVNTLIALPSLGRGSERNETILKIYGELNAIRALHETITPKAIAGIQVSLANQERLANQVTRQAVVLGVIIVVVGVLLSFFLARLLVEPLKKLQAAAVEIGKGNFDVKTGIQGTDEVANLARAITEMGGDIKTKFQLEKHSEELEQELKIRANELESNVYDLERARLASLNILEDLSEEKAQIEQKVQDRTRDLEEERAKLSHVTESMAVGAVLMDSAGHVLFMNNAAKKMLGSSTITTTQGVLNSLSRTFPNADIKTPFARFISGESLTIREVTARDGIFKLDFRLFAVKNSELPADTEYFIWIQDITTEALLERSKSEFVAIASHQLRTPLTISKGNIEMLLDENAGKLNKEQIAMLGDVQKSNINLIALVNAMLDITKIEQGSQKMKLETSSIEKILEGVLIGMEDLAKKENVEIQYNHPEKVLPEIPVDRMRVEQIFRNILDNAIKYSGGKKDSKSTVTVTLREVANSIEIVFEDTGIGIPKAEQEKIFERFYRASNASRHRASGTGLGLYVAKAITEKHGGSIDFISKKDSGSKFRVRLPIKK